MHAEFTRYGLAKYRALTGILQISAALGLCIGYVLPILTVLACGGLALQMLAGIVVRRWIQDSWLQCLPAIFYCAVNTYLVIRYI